MHRTPAMAGGAFRSSALPRKPAVMFRLLPLLLSALLLLGAADAAWAQQGRGRGGPPPRGPDAGPGRGPRGEFAAVSGGGSGRSL